MERIKSVTAAVLYPTLRQNNTPRKNCWPLKEILDKYISFDDVVLSRRIATLLQKFLDYYKYPEKACVCISGKVLW